MRVKSADIQCQPGREERVVEPLAELKEARVALAHAKQNDARRAFGWKSIQSFDGQDEGRDIHGREPGDQRFVLSHRDVAEKAE